MSRTVENRVVQMQFQNKQFEDAVAQSRQSISLLEKDLKLLEGVQALKNLDAKVQSIDLDPIAHGVETLTQRFSTMGVVGMQVIKNITDAIYGKLIGCISTVISKFSGLFNTIYTKGMSRANNIQQANFALQGLLSTQYQIEDENGKLIADQVTIKKKQDAISKAIDASVSGTAYGYDQAARIASTLAASYGTSEEGIKNIGYALKTVVGVAGQTGQEFDTVASLFTKVAASGRVMGEDLNRISGWGLGASDMIAEYINKDKELTKYINESIATREKKRKEAQKIDAADVREAASRGAISADLFMKVFNPFFENAQKANDTLNGITSNINAALGRIGAAFIMPIMQNEGPLVKFLQAVRKILVDILNGLNKLKIPKNVTDFIGSWLTSMSTFIDNIAKADFSKLPLFERLANVIKTFTGAFSTHPQSSNVDTYSSILKEQLDLWHEQFQTQEEIVADIMGEDFSGPSLWHTILTGNMDSNYANIYSAIKSMFKYRISEISDLKKSLGTDKYWTTDDEILQIYLEYFTKTMGSSLDWGQVKYLTVATKDWKDKILTLMKVTDETTKMTDEIREAMNAIGYPILDDDKENIKNIVEFNNKIKNAILEDWDTILVGDNLTVKDLREEVQERYKAYQDYYDKIPEIAAKLAGEATDKMAALRPFSVDIWQYVAQAITSVTDGLTLLGSIFDHAVSNVFGNKVVTVFDILFGRKADPETVKKIVNNVFESIAKYAEDFSKFIARNAGKFDKLFKGIMTIVKGAATLIGAIFKIGKNAIKSFAPLLERIFDLIVGIFGGINELGEEGDKLISLETIVNAVSGAIDWFAQQIIGAWDAVANFIEGFTKEDVYGTLQKFYDIACLIGDYLYTNWPKWMEKLQPYIDDMIEGFKFMGEFLKENLVEALKFIEPYFNDFIDWLSEITDGAVDLHEPINGIKDILEDTAPVVESVNDSIETISDTVERVGGAVGGGFLLGSFTDMGPRLNAMESLGNGFSSIATGMEKVGKTIDTHSKAFDYLKNFLSMPSAKNGASKETPSDKELTPLAKFALGVADIFNKIKKVFTGEDLSPLVDFAKLLAKWYVQIKQVLEKIKVDISDKVKESDFFKLVKAKIEEIKKWVTNFDIDRIIDLVGKIVGIISGGALATGVHKSLWGAGVFLTKLPKTAEKMTKAITGTVKAFSPLATADNKTTRIKARGENLKKFGEMILMIGGAVALIAGAMWIVSQIPEDRLKSSIMVVAGIFAAIAILTVIILAALGSANSKSMGVSVNEFGAITLLGKALKTSDNTLTTKSSNLYKSLAAMAAVIAAIGVAVLLITASLWIISTIDPTRLDSSKEVLYTIMLFLIGMIALVGLFAVALTGRQSHTDKKSFQSSSGDWKILAGLAAVIFVIGDAVLKIAGALALLGSLPLNNMDKAMEVFGDIVVTLIVLIALVGAIAVILNEQDSRRTASLGSGNNGAFKALLGIGVVIYLISHAIVTIIEALAIVSHLPLGNMDRALTLFDNITGMLILFVGVIGILALALGSNITSGTSGKKMIGILILLGGMVAVFALVLPEIIIAIAGLLIVISTSGVSEAAITSACAIMLAISFALGLFIAFVAGAAVAVATIGGTKALVAIGLIALIFASIALIIWSIGDAITKFGESGFTAEEISSLLTVIGVMLGGIVVLIGILAIVAVATEAAGGPLYIIAIIGLLALLFGTLAGIFYAIGSMVLNIATGIQMLTQAFMAIVTFLSVLDDKTIDKVINNAKKFFSAIGDVILTALLAAVAVIDAHRETIKEAIAAIIKFLFEVTGTVILTAFTSLLDILSKGIGILSTWLTRNWPQIHNIIVKISAMLYDIINSTLDNIMKLIFGDNYDGSTSGYLGQLTNGLLNWLNTFFLNDGSPGRQALRNLMDILQTDVHDGIIDFLHYIQDSNDIPDEAFKTVNAVINSFADAVDNNGADFVDAVNRLLGSVLNCIKYALGLPTDESFETPSNVNAEAPENYIKDFIDLMCPGFNLTHDMITAITGFITDIKNKFVEKIKDIKDEIKGLGENFADDFITGIKWLLKIASPSKTMEEIADYTVQGFTDEIQEQSRSVSRAGISTATAYLKSFRQAMQIKSQSVAFLGGIKSQLQLMISRLGDTMRDSVNEYVITPIMDLTQIQEGINTVNSLFDENGNFNMDSLSNITSSMSASNTAEGFDNANLGDMEGIESLDTNQIINFTQNNYSPESLSRIDIYRDTKNILNNPEAMSTIVSLLK